MAALDATRGLDMHTIRELMGEVLVPGSDAGSCMAWRLRCLARRPAAAGEDQLGRAGRLRSRVERDARTESIFDADSLELLGHRDVLVDPQPPAVTPRAARRAEREALIGEGSGSLRAGVDQACAGAA